MGKRGSQNGGLAWWQKSLAGRNKRVGEVRDYLMVGSNSADRRPADAPGAVVA